MLIPVEEYNAEVKQHISNVRKGIEPFELELMKENPIITLYLSRDFDLIHKDFGEIPEALNAIIREQLNKSVSQSI